MDVPVLCQLCSLWPHKAQKTQREVDGRGRRSPLRERWNTVDEHDAGQHPMDSFAFPLVMPSLRMMTVKVFAGGKTLYPHSVSSVLLVATQGTKDTKGRRCPRMAHPVFSGSQSFFP